MSIAYSILSRFSLKQLDALGDLLPKRYHQIYETIRLSKYVESTDFSSIEVEKLPICLIEDGSFEYPLFQMSFFCNMVTNAIYCLSKGYAPVISFINPNENINLWEQFYVQPYRNENFELDNKSIFEKCPVKQADIFLPTWPTKEDIQLYSQIFGNIAVLNTSTKQYIDDEIKTIIGDKRVIGVLVRGTDYTSNKPLGHPIQPKVAEVIKHVKDKMASLNCNYIYLATEEEAVVKEFEKEFPGHILTNKREYYDEFYNLKKLEGDSTRISWVHHDRENDNRLKSLEYLSSLYILSKCVVLIGGNTGGSRMALYLNGNKYEYIHLFDYGLYS